MMIGLLRYSLMAVLAVGGAPILLSDPLHSSRSGISSLSPFSSPLLWSEYFNALSVARLSHRKHLVLSQEWLLVISIRLLGVSAFGTALLVLTIIDRGLALHLNLRL